MPTSSPSSLSNYLSINLLLHVIYIYLCLPPPPLYLSTSPSIYLLLYVRCIHLLPVHTSSSSLSNYLSINQLLHVVYIYLCLPPPPLYLSISLSIYSCMLNTSLYLTLGITLVLFPEVTISRLRFSANGCPNRKILYEFPKDSCQNCGDWTSCLI